MLLMHSNNREEIKTARAGDIVALVGLKETTTGDTRDTSKQIILERMEFPKPVIEIAVEPKQRLTKKMGLALQRLAEDPSFSVSVDHESGQTIMKGRGELHLDVLVDRMKREFKVEANIGAPQVAYRETITQEVEVDYTHKKQSGGSGQFARVIMQFKPSTEVNEETGEKIDFAFTDPVVGGNVPKEYIQVLKRGLHPQKTAVVLSDGSYHDVDSSDGV